MKKTDLYLVDVDHTLVNGDTFWMMLRAGLSRRKWIYLLWLFWLPKMLWRGLAGKSSGAMKGTLFISLTGVTAEAEWNAIIARAIPRYVLPRINQKLLKELQTAKNQGHTVVLVTASPALWIQPLSELWGFEFLASAFEVRKGVLTGRLLGPNCKGVEKVRRIQQVYDLSAFHNIFAWGNTGDDEPMLNLAPRHHQFRI